MAEKILQMKAITKAFGGVLALDKVDFALEKGEIHALIGENGAGKSTLMKVLLGIHSPDVGEIFYEGRQVRFASPAEALRNGISMIHQEISLVAEMDVAENIWLGREKQFSRMEWIQVGKRYRAAQQLLDQLGIKVDPRAKIKNLSVAQMQLVELARAVSYDPRIIIMDEPTSALTDQEIELLYRIVRELSKKGVAVVFISHKLEEIFEICERATVLRDGTLVAVRSCQDLTKSDLINMIVGRNVDVLFAKQPVPLGDVLLEVDNLSRGEACQDVSFSVRQGEVLGLCGLMGAGRSEILRAAFGIDRKTSGEIRIGGVRKDIRTPKDAIQSGIGMVTEDRLRQGVIYSMSVMSNSTIAVFDRLCNRFGFYRKLRERQLFAPMAKEMAIKYDSPNSLIHELSGGNQQKVIIGRWLLTKPKVLFLDEPTRGIDVGSKAEIYKLINKLAAEGMAIVMVSSELPELLSLCDRIAVVRQGKIVFECVRAQATQELLMQRAFGS